MNQVTIPLLRKIIPGVIAQDIVNVQPMTGHSKQIFMLKSSAESEKCVPYQGERRHSFFYGWLRYYGTDWIPEPLWWKIKVKGL